MVTSKPMTKLPSALLSEASGVLLVVAPAEEIAKRIESHLRNAGHPLRVAWINDLEDLQDVVQRNPPDLVLADDDEVHALNKQWRAKDKPTRSCRPRRPRR